MLSLPTPLDHGLASDSDLQIFHGIPVVLKEDDSVGSSEVETQPPHMSGEQENVH